jgi:hypothetical protein
MGLVPLAEAQKMATFEITSLRISSHGFPERESARVAAPEAVSLMKGHRLRGRMGSY